MRKDDLKILKFPNSISNLEKKVEAILFAAEEPLDLESIQARMKVKANVPKILESLKNHLKTEHVVNFIEAMSVNPTETEAHFYESNEFPLDF